MDRSFPSNATTKSIGQTDDRPRAVVAAIISTARVLMVKSAVMVFAAVTVLGWRLYEASPVGATVPPEDNPFLPENQSLSECISAVPRPGCGSEARGGWAQNALLGALLLGLAFIGWRVSRSARATAARRRPDPSTS